MPLRTLRKTNLLFLSKKIQYLFFTFLICFLLPNWSSAGPILIGPELIFTNHKIEQLARDRIAKHKVESSKNTILGFIKNMVQINPQIPTKDGEFLEAEKLTNAIMENCKSCVLEMHKGKFGLQEFLIRFPNSFWINIGCDPGTVEIQTPPLSLEEYTSLGDFIQENIYDVAETVGLKSIRNYDGHSNFGVLSAFDNVKEFASFLLDQVNHPELALGILGQDLKNAPPLAIQSQEQLDRFYQLIDEVQNGIIVSIKDLADQINHKVYYITSGFSTTDRSSFHNQAISIKYLSNGLRNFPFEDAPMELRYTPARANFKLVLLNYELLEERIKFLKKNTSNLVFYKKLNVEEFKKGTGGSSIEKLIRFNIFITEMGHKVEKYLPLVFNASISLYHYQYPKNYNNFFKGKFFDPDKGTDTYFTNEDHIKDSTAIITGYVPDLIDSDWARKQMRSVLNDPAIPKSALSEILLKIDELINSEMTSRPTVGKFLKDYRNQIFLSENVLAPVFCNKIFM